MCGLVPRMFRNSYGRQSTDGVLIYVCWINLEFNAESSEEFGATW